MADDKKPSNWKSWHDRYATDPDFKKQVDAQRKAGDTKKAHANFTDTLEMVRGASSKRKKLY